ncbi:MAG: FAD/FMN-containing dehydrogenase [Gammaproteobacteria bacterium]|jgi:FAD/FMN-containing dehydrogenase
MKNKSDTQDESSITKLCDDLLAIVGREYLLTDSGSRLFYSQDIYSRGRNALAVAQPANTQELAAIVAITVASGYAAVPRGGGMSYTGGYLPVHKDTVVIDMLRMNQVLEVNSEDMYVTVECGCTWEKLYKTLLKTGLRTPFWGTLSGIKATVGGGLSQNSLFWGSGQFGSAADSVLSLDVVLADGSVLSTGSASQRNSSPFFRHYGPDLTGLFTCDTGALGFKATATLPLMPDLPAKEYLAFDFKDAASAIAAMSDVARHKLAMECFAFDPFLQGQRMKRQSLSADVKSLAAVMKSSKSMIGGIVDGARVALAGRTFMDDVDFSVQFIVEDRNKAAAVDRAAAIRKLCAQRACKEIENSIPKITRSNPFGPLNSMLGPEGERWLPIHGMFPHSRILEAYLAVEALFDRHREKSEKLGIGIGYLFATVSTNGFILEPVFFWPDEINEIHKASVEAKHLTKLKGFPANLQAREMVAVLRGELIELLSELGAVHTQIGKSYRYREGLRPAAWELVKSLKKVLDPTGRINPGSLGLD